MNELKSEFSHIKNWQSSTTLVDFEFLCPFCENQVGSVTGYISNPSKDTGGNQTVRIYVCPICKGVVTRFISGEYIPTRLPGKPIVNADPELEELYNEARRCASAAAYSACALICRKMLMSFAVKKGDTEKKPFTDYIKFIEDGHFVPPNSNKWLEEIRTKGGDMTHKVAPATHGEALRLIDLCWYLLEFNYGIEKVMTPPASAPNT